MSEHAFDPRVEFSDWLHNELVREYALETEAWATERIARVMARLNAERMDVEPIEAVILWLPRSNAFTFAGRYIYISRRLLERLPSDESVAYVLAHEIAHHDCGHLDLYKGWSSWLPKSKATSYLAALAARGDERGHFGWHLPAGKEPLHLWGELLHVLPMLAQATALPAPKW